MGNSPNLETPGGLIQSARKASGMSIAELSVRTKIPSPVLEALERDEYQKISGTLYIKSFLRTCAVEVGLDVEIILAAYVRFAGEVQGAGGGARDVWGEDQVEIVRLGLPWGKLAAVGGLLVMVGIALFVMAHRRSGSDMERDDAATLVVPSLALKRPPLHSADLPVSASRTPAAPQSIPPPAEQVDDQVDDQLVAAAMVGDADLVFSGDKHYLVVLRILTSEPLVVRVKKDADSDFQTADWPASGAIAPTFTGSGVVAGRIYRVREGMAVYWGANDHFVLRLDHTSGVSVTLNGKTRRVDNLRSDGEMLLDALGN